MIYLGLDLSTTTCGFAYSTDTNEILDAGFIDISEVSDYKEKAKLIISKLDESSNVFDIINLEDYTEKEIIDSKEVKEIETSIVEEDILKEI